MMLTFLDDVVVEPPFDNVFAEGGSTRAVILVCAILVIVVIVGIIAIVKKSRKK